MDKKISNIANGPRLLRIANQDGISSDQGFDGWSEWFGRIADKYEALEEENERLKSGWISVEDELPKPMTLATLVLRMHNPWPTTRFYRGEGVWDTRDTITYWQPMPDPPKGKA